MSSHAIEKEGKWPPVAVILPGLLFLSLVGSVWVWMFGTMLGIGQPNYPTTPVSDVQGENPALIQTRGGSLMIAFRTRQGIFITTSENGSKWGPAAMVVNTSVDSHALIQNSNGSFMLACSLNRLISESDRPGYEGKIIVTASQDGVTWSPPTDVLVAPYLIYQISLLQLANGSYILASGVTRPNNNGFTQSIEIWFSNEAQSWSHVTTIPLPSSQGLCMAEAADGSIFLAIGQTGYMMIDGYETSRPSIRICRSIDGYNWNLCTTINATRIYARPSLVATADGPCILAYSDEPPRPVVPYYGPILILTSFSDSQTIKTQITPVSKRSTSPSIIQTNNRMLALAFIDMNTDKIMFIPAVPYPDASK